MAMIEPFTNLHPESQDGVKSSVCEQTVERLYIRTIAPYEKNRSATHRGCGGGNPFTDHGCESYGWLAQLWQIATQIGNGGEQK